MSKALKGQKGWQGDASVASLREDGDKGDKKGRKGQKGLKGQKGSNHFRVLTEMVVLYRGFADDVVRAIVVVRSVDDSRRLDVGTDV